MALHIATEESPNGPASDEFVFNELGKPRRVEALKVDIRGRETLCAVTGVGRGGTWVPATAVKVADSSDGHAYLIHGGEWGLRLKPRDSREGWSFEAKEQWGEPFKVYGSEDDIVYEKA